MISGTLRDRLRAALTDCGFDLVGFAPPALPEASPRLAAWLAEGRHGSMRWLERDPGIRTDVRQRWEEAQTVVCLALSYATSEEDRGGGAGRGAGWISRYAWGRDYHKVLRKPLLAACRVLEEYGGRLARPYTDTGPLLERGFHAAAGTGWVGRNACLIHPEWGSWLFLSEIVTDLRIEPDGPQTDQCASCTLCLEACPTGALLGPGELDSRLCISYHTIENRDGIPEDIRGGMGDHVFGCDICQEVCPWNSRVPLPDRDPFRPRPGGRAPDLDALAALDRAAFDERFAGSAVRRAHWEGFLRNVVVAMGNEADPIHGPALERLARHESEVVREHARWALERLPESSEAGGSDAGDEPGQIDRR